MDKIYLILSVITLLPVISKAGMVRQPVKDESWDFLLLAQFWPGASCIYFDEYTECPVPQGQVGWIIHGLWPSVFSGQQPRMCDPSMTFDITEIQPLRTELDKQWPYLNKSGDSTFLWKHEWDEHGTCAYTLPILQGELSYFNVTLQLHSTLDIFSALSTANIVPTTDNLYSLTDIWTAVVNKYTKLPQIACLHSKHKYYLDQIYLCYNKSLNLIDCPETHHHIYWNSMTKAKKLKLSLHFESEKSEPVNSQTVDPRDYFIKCPRDEVYYIPIPDRKTEIDTKV
uniref:Uncharacterized protein n=1 Tax=Arion vulgaris TaxID=1028688 RepID=A0A0B7A509_9EUPU